MKKQDILQDTAITVALTALCCYVFITAGGFKGESGLFPRIIAAGTFALCIMQLGNQVREYFALTVEEKAPAIKKADYVGFTLASATLIGYVVLIFVLGYYVATAAYLAVSMFVFGYRKKLPVICITGGMIVFVYALFSVLLRVRLPSGLLF